MAELETDAATGEELIFFYRRGAPFLFLRHGPESPEYPRFIARLRDFGIAVTYSMEYESLTRSWKNIYIDVKAESKFPDADFPKREELANKLKELGDEAVRQNFGSNLLNSLEETISGTEYSSEGVEVTYPRAHVNLAWAHRDQSLEHTQKEVFLDV